MKYAGASIILEGDEPDTENEVLWLYPHEWYDFIPEGFPITTISNNNEFFAKGKTDNDMRFGALSFGFKRKAS